MCQVTYWRRCGQQLLSGLHVGNPLGGERVAAQVRKSSRVVKAVGLQQLLKHGHKALGCITRTGHDAVAHAVGLALHLSRKIQLPLHGHRLPARNEGCCGLRVRASGQSAQNHGAQQHGRLAALTTDQTGNVPLGDVAELVGQHRGQLVLAGHLGNQAQVHAHVAAGQRKRIYGAVTAQKHRPGKSVFELGRQFAPLLRPLQQTAPNAPHVFIEQGVVYVVGVAKQLAGNAITQLALCRHADFHPVAQAGQLGLGVLRCEKHT